jgi:hypothetical protein
VRSPQAAPPGALPKTTPKGFRRAGVTDADSREVRGLDDPVRWGGLPRLRRTPPIGVTPPTLPEPVYRVVFGKALGGAALGGFPFARPPGRATRGSVRRTVLRCHPPPLPNGSNGRAHPTDGDREGHRTEEAAFLSLSNLASGTKMFLCTGRLEGWSAASLRAGRLLGTSWSQRKSVSPRADAPCGSVFPAPARFSGSPIPLLLVGARV